MTWNKVQRWVGGVFVVALAPMVALTWTIRPADASAQAVTSTTAKIKSFDLAFDYPASWTVFAFDAKALAQQRKRLLKANPKLANVFDGQAESAAAQGYEFAAVDLDAAGSGRAISAISVSSMDGFPSSLKALVDEIKPIYEKSGASLIDSSVQRVSGRRSFRIDIRITFKTPTGETVAMRMSQLAVPRGVGTALITIGAPDGAEGSALIDSILASVREL